MHICHYCIVKLGALNQSILGETDGGAEGRIFQMAEKLDGREKRRDKNTLMNCVLFLFHTFLSKIYNKKIFSISNVLGFYD